MSEPYCDKCERWFGSYSSLKQHIQDSDEHNACKTCGYDANTWDQLARHVESHHACGRLCHGCQTVFFSHRSYWDHIDDDNVCTVCYKHFNNPSLLRRHKREHEPRRLAPPPRALAPPPPPPQRHAQTDAFECYGCDREFSRYGSMILHLESRSCSSGIDRDHLNTSAAYCYQSRYFMHEDSRQAIFDDYDLADDCFHFECPDCDIDFRKLSGLFQHIESHTCDQTLYDGAIGKLRKWLYKRHG